MFGIPIEGTANIFCDSKLVVTSSTIPDSTLKKKHNAIAYHRVQEAVAAETLWIAHVHSKSNNADLLTKPVLGPELRNTVNKIYISNFSTDKLITEHIIL